MLYEFEFTSNEKKNYKKLKKLSKHAFVYIEKFSVVNWKNVNEWLIIDDEN